jgi:nucleotide-binding universal stress UspA family protein
MFRKILVPIDVADVEIAQPALKAAQRLARYADGDLRLINVQSLMPVTYMEYVPADFDVKLRQNAEEALAEIKAKLHLPADRLSSTVKLGSIYGEVLDEAKTWGADVVVVGSHRPRMATYLLGSNATTIVRHALCSVLVIREAD